MFWISVSRMLHNLNRENPRDVSKEPIKTRNQEINITVMFDYFVISSL